MIALHADTVERSDGSRIEGEVLTLNDTHVAVQVDGETVRIPRRDVASIHFVHPAPPLKVEIRNVKSDDSIDVLLEDEIILSKALAAGAWIDLTPKLKDGNNALKLRIHNERAGWAYHLSLRINGIVTELSCGHPYDLARPCRCCGKDGLETGVIDDLPPVWVYVDRELGHAEVLP